MKPSSKPKRVSPTKARNAALLNQLATPGLGSLLAGRWLAGSGQLLLALVGFGFFVRWFGQTMGRYYSLMFNENPSSAPMTYSSLVLGLVLFLLAWCWSLVTSISLMRGAAKGDVEGLKLFSAGLVKLDPAQVTATLGALPQWQLQGNTITRTYEFKDFPAAMQFVNTVADLAEQAQHHPDIDVRWNRVTLAFTTHDASGLTAKDFALAGKCDGLASAKG